MLVNKQVLSALKNALKLGMVAENPEAIPIIEAIQPVVQVEDVKLIGTLLSLTVEINLQTDLENDEFVPAYTCPGGKRAYIMHAGKKATVGSTAISIGKAGSVTDYADISEFTGDPIIVFPMGEIWLDAGKSIGCVETKQAGDDAVKVSYVIVEVDW